MARIFFAIGLAALAGIVMPAHAAQKFEVASVRLEDPHSAVDTNTPQFRVVQTVFPSNRLTIRHTGLKSLICESYGAKCSNILGAPDWLDRQHYDLDAKVEGDARLTQEQMRPLLQNLLEERFRLQTHHEQKIVPGYALVVANGGSKLKANTGAPFTGMNSGFEFKFQNASVDSIVFAAERELKQPVVDKTGLEGKYDFDLIFTREDSPTDTPHPDYGSIFTAIEKQLGLKLTPEKIPVDYLVIDHVERVPIDN
jgi:uncharacterized protein (TIGR03435 family)